MKERLAPHGSGRVRDANTDHDLRITTKAILSKDGTEIINLDEILSELFNNSLRLYRDFMSNTVIRGSPLQRQRPLSNGGSLDGEYWNVYEKKVQQ